MKNNNTIGGCLGAILLFIVVIIFGPALSYFFGWITGHLLSWVCGDTVINGLNYLFNTTRFTVDMLPTICGTLGVIGSFFKSTSTVSSKK
jgi:hypothetical protein